MTNGTPHTNAEYESKELINRWTYRDVMVGWTRALIKKDINAIYVPFSIADDHRFETNSILNNPALCRREIIRASEAATLALNPNFSRNNLRRRDPKKCFGALVLFARIEKQFHCHGWIRVPIAAGEEKTSFTFIRHHRNDVVPIF